MTILSVGDLLWMAAIAAVLLSHTIHLSLAQGTTDPPIETVLSSDVPSDVPSAFASNWPSNVPTILPTARPTPPVTLVFEPYIEMVLLNIEANWSTPGIYETWARITSEHVQSFWNSFPSQPFYVGTVLTQQIRNARLSSSESLNNATNGTTNGTSAIAPLLIAYNQSIMYGSYNPLLDPTLTGNAVDRLFTLPFDLDGLQYAVALANATNNSRPILVQQISIEQAPTAAPTRSPSAQTEVDTSETRIITITIAITTLSLLVAGGYIVYLTRKEDQDPNAGPLFSESFETDDYEDDEYCIPRSEHMASPFTLTSPTIATAPTVSLHNHSTAGDDVMGEPLVLADTYDTEISSAAGSRHREPEGAIFSAVAALPISVINGIEERSAELDDSHKNAQPVPTSAFAADLPGSLTPAIESLSPLAFHGFQMEVHELSD